MQDWLSSLSRKSTLDDVDLHRKDNGHGAVYDGEASDLFIEPRNKFFRAHMEGLRAEFDKVVKENRMLMFENQEIRAELVRTTNAPSVGNNIEGLCSSHPPVAITDGSGQTPRTQFFTGFDRPDASAHVMRRPSISSSSNISRRRKENLDVQSCQTSDEDNDLEDFLQTCSYVPSPKVKKEPDFFSSVGGRSDVDCLETLQLWPTWSEETAQKAFAKQRTHRRSTFHILDGDTQRKTGEKLMTKSSFQRFVSRPSSPRRICWDLISVFVMGYDVIRIPLEVFDIPLGNVELYIGFATTIFWTLDICASFFAGYHVGGLIEMRPIKVCIHYLRTWFPIDLFVVTIDWGVIGFRADDVEGIGLMRLNKTLRFVRVLRVLRLLRLLRMLKVLSVMADLHDMIHSEYLLTFIKICQFFLGILVINHYFACGWYGLGVTGLSIPVEDTNSNSWISVSRNFFFDQNGGTKEPTLDYYYFSCLHWSLTQFTPASMEVVPCNSVERVYTIAVLLFAVLLFSSLLSSITTSMIALRTKSSERRKQQSYVRRYITDKHVTLDLGNRISGFLRTHNFNVKSRKCVCEDDISAFRILPESLRSQLRYEVHVPNLHKHPFFDYLRSLESDETLLNVCNSCCKEKDLAYGQEMFACGTPAWDMYVTVRGDCMYYQDSTDISTRIQPRSFISECVLWMSWDHKGRLVASEHVELVSISSVDFRMVCRRSPLFVMCKCYANRFHEKIIENSEMMDDNLTDLSERPDRLEEIMAEALRNASLEYVPPPSTTPSSGVPFLRRGSSGSLFVGAATAWVAPIRWWSGSSKGGDTSPHSQGPRSPKC